MTCWYDMAVLSKLLGAATDLRAVGATASVGVVLLLYFARARRRQVELTCGL